MRRQVLDIEVEFHHRLLCGIRPQVSGRRLRRPLRILLRCNDLVIAHGTIRLGYNTAC